MTHLCSGSYGAREGAGEGGKVEGSEVAEGGMTGARLFAIDVHRVEGE